MSNYHSSNSTRVGAVVATFQPSPKLIERVLKLLRQVPEVLIVDDGSSNESQFVLNQLSDLGARVVTQKSNLGIAAAINLGFQHFESLGAELILTLDQDSDLPEDYVPALTSEYDRLVSLGLKVGLVAPQFFSSFNQSFQRSGVEYLDAVSPIQSGQILSLEAVNKIGPQNEKYFIDLVDTEYFFRAKELNYVCACVPNIQIEHGFGNEIYLFRFGKQQFCKDGSVKVARVSSPFRYYYRARNRVFLNWRYRSNFKFLKVLLSQTLNDLVLDFAVAVKNSTRPSRLMKIILAGWLDGFMGRTGKIPTKLFRLAETISWSHPVEDNNYFSKEER